MASRVLARSATIPRMVSERRVVRRARAEDGAEVWPLVRDFALSYEPQKRVFERSFTDLLSRPDTLVAVADEDGSIIGYLLASWHVTSSPTAPSRGWRS